MNGDYRYITDKLGEPLYWDIFGAPHYDIGSYALSNTEEWMEFIQEMQKISCQACGKEFIVQLTHPVYSGDIYTTYGDPPRHDNCVGDTMSSDGPEVITKEEITEFLQYAKSLSNDQEYSKQIDKIINMR